MIAGTLEIQLMANVARLAKDMDEAKRGVNNAMREIERAADMAKAALGAMGVALSAQAFAGMIKGAIEAAAKLKDVSEMTGVAASRLSALQEVGKVTGTSIEQIGTLMTKLARAMTTTTDEGKDTSRALAAIGLKAADLRNMEVGDQMMAIAKAMNNFKDGGGKAAVAMQLFGKAGAEAIPYLKELAETQQLQARVTDEQVKQADEFTDQYAKLSASSEAWKTELAMAMVPALLDAVNAMLGLTNQSGGLREAVRALAADGSIERWTTAAVEGISYVIDAVQGVKVAFEFAGKNLAGFALQAQYAMKLTPDQIVLGTAREGIGYVQKVLEERNRVIKEVNDDLEKTLQKPLVGQKFREALAEAKRVRQEAGQYFGTDFVEGSDGAKTAVVKFASAVKESAKVEKSAYDDLIQSIKKKIAEQQAEYEGTAKLTAAQKLEVDIKADLTGKYAKLTDQQKAAVLKALEEYKAIEALVDAKEKMAKITEELIKTNTNALNDIKRQIETEKEHAATLGLSKEATAEYAAAKLDAAAADKRLAAAVEEVNAAMVGMVGGDEGVIRTAQLQAEAYRDQAAALSELASAKRQTAAKEAAVEQAKQSADAWKKFSGDIESALTDALMRGFENGSGFGENFIETLKNTLKTAALKVVVQALVQPAANGISTLLVGENPSVSSGGTFGTAANIFNAGSSLYNISQGKGLLGSGYNWFANSSVGQWMGLASSSGAAAGSAAAGTFMTELGASEAIGSIGATGWFGGAAAGASAAGGAAAIEGGAALAGGAAAEGGIMSGLAAMGPYGWIAAAVIAAISFLGGKGETRSGGQYGYGNAFDVNTQDYNDFGSSVSLMSGPSGGQIGEMEPVIKSVIDSIDSLLKNLGSAATITGFQAGLETSEKGRGGVYSGGALSTGVKFGEMGEGSNYSGDKYEDTSAKSGNAEEIAKQFAEDMLQVTIEALQAATDIPQQIKEMLAGVDAEALTGDQAEALLQTITAFDQFMDAVNTMPFENLRDLSFEATKALITSAGGIDTFSSNLSAYYQAAYSADEKLEISTRNLNESFASLGEIMPENIAGFRSLVEGLDLTTEADRATFTSLMQLAPAFFEVANAAEAAEDERRQWQDKLDVLTGAATQREIELKNALASTTDETTQALIRQVFAQEDLKASTDDVIAGFESIMSSSQGADTFSRAGSSADDFYFPSKTFDMPQDDGLKSNWQQLQLRMYEAAGDKEAYTALKRAIEMDKTDGSMRDLLQSIFDAEDAASAAAAAQEKLNAAQQAAAQRQQLELRLLQAQGDATGALALQRRMEQDAADESSRSILDQIYAAEDARAAASRQQELDASRRQLEIEIMVQSSDAAGALAAQRRIELEAMDESLRGMQSRIYALQDANAAVDAAFGTLERSVQAERDRMTEETALRTETIKTNLASARAANEAESEATRNRLNSLNELISGLDAALKSTVVDSPAINFARRQSGIQTLRNASRLAASGQSLAGMPGLNDALAAVSAPSEQYYATLADYVRAQSDVAGLITSINGQAKAQKSVAEMTLDALKGGLSELEASTAIQLEELNGSQSASLQRLDEILAEGKRQIDVLNGVDLSVLSVSDAVQNLNQAIAAAANLRGGVAAAAQFDLAGAAILGTAEGQDAVDIVPLVDEMKAVRAELASIKADAASIKRYTGDASTVLRDCSQGGDKLRTVAA